MYLGMERLEKFTEQSVLHEVGDRKLRERTLVPGDDHQGAIHGLEREIETLERISGTDMVVSAKRAEIENLKAQSFAPDRYVLKTLDITVREHWAPRSGRQGLVPP
jgi:hypothetical protein